MPSHPGPTRITGIDDERGGFTEPLSQEQRMATTPDGNSAPGNALIQQLLDALDALSGLHPGFRPVHAKGVMSAGTFTPSPAAAKLTRAPNAARASTPVIVRFSDAAGVPTVADNHPLGASPRGIATRFYLADHVHTDRSISTRRWSGRKRQ
jgi:catalase